ncbi:MAG: magnesium transporter [Chloroflexi bacterium]|nr:magnesium transporter [Chloroflexota bacterium]
MAPFGTPGLEALVARLQALLEGRNLQGAIQLLQKEHPSDIADLLELFDEKQRVQLFRLLNLEDAAEVLDEMSAEATLGLVEAVPDENIADLLEEMAVDDAAALLSDLPEGRAEDLLALVGPGEAAEIEKLLAHPDDTAGRLMNSEVVRVRKDWTLQETLEFLRSLDPDAETLAYLYVADEQERLVGVLPLRDLVTHSPDFRVGDVMDPNVVSVRVDADQEEAARLVSQYDFFAIPVVDSEGRLVGVITHDDVVDVLSEEFTEDFQRLGGSQPLEDEYLATSVATVFQKRVGWLLVLFLTEMLTGTVMRLYEQEMSAAIALAFFIPLLIGTGGNSGSQTTSTIVRALALGEVQLRDAWRLLWHEFKTGFLLGLVMAIVGFVRALLWGTGLPLALTVALALFAIVLWANIIGSLLPVLAERFRIDPAVISGPVMSTLIDATGLVIYFSLARAIIGL